MGATVLMFYKKYHQSTVKGKKKDKGTQLARLLEVLYTSPPGRRVHSNTNMIFLGIFSYVAIMAQRVFGNIYLPLCTAR